MGDDVWRNFVNIIVGQARIKCSQNGSIYTTHLRNLSTEEGMLEDDDFVKGAQLIFDYKGHSYPVQFWLIPQLVCHLCPFH